MCAEQGLAVLWATHLVDEVWAEDDLVVLHEGQVREAGPVRDILERSDAPDVITAFTGLTRPDADASPESGTPRP